MGKNMGKLEKEVLAGCKECLGSSVCDNKSDGGEKVHAKSVRFLYVCVRTSSDQRAASSAA